MTLVANEMFDYMQSCNGEIRVMPARYGSGWLAGGCATIEWEFDNQWSDLVSGDNDYFEAREFFNNNEYLVLIEGAKTAKEAFELCIRQLEEIKPS